MMPRALPWALWLLSVALLALMVWISFLHLMPRGTLVLDGWALPYSAAEVDGYLAALGAQGINKYLGPLQAIDTIFPACLALAIALTFLVMTRNWRPLPRALLLVLPLGYGATDYLENRTIAEMLQNWPETTDFATAQLASRLTSAKFALLGLAAVIWLALTIFNDAKGLR